MSDHVERAVDTYIGKQNGHPQSMSQHRAQLQKGAKELLPFINSLIEQGPDEEMVHCPFTEFVSISDSADIGWTDETRALLKEFATRLGAIAQETG